MIIDNVKLPISGVIVSYNEGRLLEKSLPALAFCKQLIVVNLESTDNTAEVAKAYNAEVWDHPRVPLVEIIHSWIKEKVEYDWILITDPDEVPPRELIAELIEKFNSLGPEVGAVVVPMKYYFKQKCLEGTFWGGVRQRVYLIHRERFDLKKYVHLSRNVREGFRMIDIQFTGSNYLHHYWMQSYYQLFEKHIRYLKNEGEARFVSGQRTSLKQIIKTPFQAFKYSFWIKRGYKDGFTGVFLSIFWTWYQTIALIELWKFQRKGNKQQATNK